MNPRVQNFQGVFCILRVAGSTASTSPAVPDRCAVRPPASLASRWLSGSGAGRFCRQSRQADGHRCQRERGEHCRSFGAEGHFHQPATHAFESVAGVNARQAGFGWPARAFDVWRARLRSCIFWCRLPVTAQGTRRVGGRGSINRRWANSACGRSMHVAGQRLRSSTYSAPVPPSSGRAEQKASTSSRSRR